MAFWRLRRPSCQSAGLNCFHMRPGAQTTPTFGHVTIHLSPALASTAPGSSLTPRTGRRSLLWKGPRAVGVRGRCWAGLCMLAPVRAGPGAIRTKVDI